MLPQIGAFSQNDVKLSNDINRQPSAVNSKLNQVSSMIGARLGNIGSPGLALQAGMFKAFGNNVLTQGVTQLTGLFSDMLGKMGESRGRDADNSSDFNAEERRTPTGLAEADRSILKEMLKALLRIDQGIDNIDGVGSVGSKKQFNPLAKQEALVDKKIKLSKDIERKSAGDLLNALEQKVPQMASARRPEHSNLQERMHNISGNLESQAMQGVYSAFGYNTFTQSITEGAGFLGDTLSDLVSGKKSPKPTKNNPTGDSHLERILGNPKTDRGELIVEPVVAEIKNSESILEKMLSSLNSMNDMFKKFFGATEKISNQEAELEKVPLPKPYKENGKYIFPPRESLLAAPAIPENIENLLDLIPGGKNKPPVPPTPKAGTSIMSKLANLGRLAAPVAIGAAPLALMYGASEWAGDTTHDIERVEGIKENVSSPLTDIMKTLGLDFGKRFEAQAAKNREGLDSSLELEANNKLNWSVEEKLQKSKTLNTKIDELEPPKAKEKPTESSNATINNTNINNQTILPNRNTVRNTDSTANRYFDRALG